LERSVTFDYESSYYPNPPNEEYPHGRRFPSKPYISIIGLDGKTSLLSFTGNPEYVEAYHGSFSAAPYENATWSLRVEVPYNDSAPGDVTFSGTSAVLLLRAWDPFDSEWFEVRESVDFSQLSVHVDDYPGGGV